MSNRRLVYLSVPYTDPDPAVMEARFMAATRTAGKLLREGFIVFSPITHGHPIAKHYGAIRDWETSKELCYTYLALTYKLVVLKLAGWDKSVGVRAEINHAEYNKLEIEYMDYEG